jgi:hypothetical protein
MKYNKPKILILDIETAPILAYAWDIWDQNIALNQIEEDWFIIAWAAKWLGESKVMYKDLRNIDLQDHYVTGEDRSILQKIWELVDEADIILTQNGKKFDAKKLNARFIINGMKPPRSYRHVDTLQIAKKNFGFTSNKLAYMSDKLCKKYKKLEHKKFPGFELWKECLRGNKSAWKEMEKYNIHDVLALEELYTKLMPWDNSVNFDVYRDELTNICKCGSKKFKKYGFGYTTTGKFQRYVCQNCGTETRSKVNLLTKEKRASLRR